jgi:hypothetical protein
MTYRTLTAISIVLIGYARASVPADRNDITVRVQQRGGIAGFVGVAHRGGLIGIQLTRTRPPGFRRAGLVHVYGGGKARDEERAPSPFYRYGSFTASHARAASSALARADTCDNAVP